MTAKELKNALLQEAVQGKLVPQISSEGNARDLMEEIRKEKLSHGFANSVGICGEKGKKSKSSDLRSKSPQRNAPASVVCVTKKELPEITEEEIPFEIPENWCWCRLGELGNFVRGNGIKRDETTNTGLPCVRYGEMYTNYKIKFSKTKSFTSKDVFEKCHKIHTNDILMALTGENKWDIALAATYEGTEEIAMGGDLCKFTPINCNSLFLVYLINSPYGIEYKRNTSTGDIIVHTSTTKLGNLLIPLPPLAEQKRIVAAIEKFVPLIEEYGKKETQLKAINEKICTLTKKAILQEAVQGKLVPQIAGEGNAKDLLEEIRKERLSHGLDFANAKSGKKKSKKETALAGSNPCDITEEEIPFEIPESWCWCRLGEICNEIKRGKSPKYADKSNFLAFAQKCNVKTGGIDLGLALYLDEKSITRYSETDNLVQGDIVINSTGGGTMGRVGLYETKVPAGIKGVYPDSHVTVIRSIGNINQHYLYYVLKLNQPVLEKCGTGSTNQTELKPAVLANFVIPLPPLAEQKRIVKAIEKLLPLCEALKV